MVLTTNRKDWLKGVKNDVPKYFYYNVGKDPDNVP